MRGGRARDHGRQPPQAARADRFRSPIRPLPEQKRKRKLAATSRGDEFRPASSAEAPARDAPLAPASSGSGSKRKKRDEHESSRMDERESSKKQKQVHLSVRTPSPEVEDEGPSESERGDDAEGEEESAAPSPDKSEEPEAPPQALGTIGSVDHELRVASQYLRCLSKHLDRFPSRHCRSAALQCIEHLQKYLR